MGWYQDNFPGSPAEKQRRFVARGVVVYSIIVGTLYYLYWPSIRRFRQELAEGREVGEWGYFTQLREEFKTNAQLNRFGAYRTKDDFIEERRATERIERGDPIGPDLSEERIREMVSKYLKR